MKQVIIFLFSCCIGCCVRSQDQSYLFSSISVKDGLYQESVNLVQQDARGFIWIAAGEVLQRFDRYRFTNLSPSQTNTFALPPGNIRSLMIDKKNRLWMLKGDSSFGYINPDDFTFHKVRIVAPTRFNQLPTALHVAKDGTILLIYVGKGIITYNEKANEAAEKYNPFFLPQGWEPTHLYQDKELNYWLGTPNGLLKYNARNGKMSYNGHNEDNDPFIDRLKEFKDIGFVYIDIKKTIWFHTRQLPKSFVGSYNTKSRELTNWVDIMNKDKDSYYECQGVSETSDGSIWMAGPNFFARADETEKKIFHIKTNQADRNSIWYDNVYSLFEDREHNIWITTNKGLYYFNPNAQVFKTVPNRLLGKDVPYKAEVSDILELADGRILVATWGNGVFCYDKNFNPVIDNIFNQQAPSGLGLTWCLMQRKNGDIWCGIQAGNIEIFEAASGKHYRIQPKELEGRTVRQLAEDSAGNVWIGSHGGHLIKMDAQTKSFSLQHHFKAVISRLFIDRSRQLWVTTDSKGVYQLNPQNATIIAHYTSNSGPNKSMRINGAADITQLNDSTMVIVADGMYFLDLRSQTFNDHSKQNILPNNNVSNVVIDKHNNIWTTTGSGICSYHLPKSKLSIYTDVDGVRTYSFNVASSCRLRNGKIVFGTNHECILFNPDEVLVNNYKVPVVQIAGISILNKTLLVDSVRKMGQLNLRYDQNALNIELVTNTYQHTYPLYYMLEGADKGWKKTGASGEVNLNYLQPGKYVFKAACMDENLQPGKITSFIIHINTPFWKAWWFYSALVLIAGAMLYLLDRMRTKRREVFFNMRSNIAGNLHQEVNTALNNINILSEMARIKADTEPQKSKEFIEQIHHQSETMIEAMDHMLWTIAPENDSMTKMLDRMEEYIQGINVKYNIELTLAVDEKVKQLQPSMQFRYESSYIFREMLADIVGAGFSSGLMEVTVEKQSMVFLGRFSNTGADMAMADNLLQRNDVRQRMDIVGAIFLCDTGKDATMVDLRIPVSGT